MPDQHKERDRLLISEHPKRVWLCVCPDHGPVHAPSRQGVPVCPVALYVGDKCGVLLGEAKEYVLVDSDAR